MNFKIIHTNDIHSDFKNFAKIASYIKKEKNDRTIILDAGDFADFKSIELQGTNGLAAIELLEATGYDAITVGNNEVFKSIETLEYMASNANIPFLSCNILTKNQEEIKGVRKSIILNKEGIRILIVGTSPSIGPFDELLGFSIKNYKESIIKELELHHGEYDICILLNHIGTENDEMIAKEVKGIDIIISGHDHKQFENAKIIDNTIINSAGAYGQHLGVLEINYNLDGIKLVDSMTISTNELEADIMTLGLLEKNKEKAMQNLGKPLFQIEKPLWHDNIEENPITNLIADGLRDQFKSDIGLINSGIINGGLTNLTVTEKKLIEICPSPLNPTYFEIKGKDLKAALEKTLDTGICLQDGKGPGFRGYHLGRLHVSGVEIQVRTNRIINILINGEELIEEKWYSVASSDYLHRGTGYETLAKNRNEEYRVEYIRDLLRKYANEKTFVQQAFIKRWIDNTI